MRIAAMCLKKYKLRMPASFCLCMLPMLAWMSVWYCLHIIFSEPWAVINSSQSWKVCVCACVYGCTLRQLFLAVEGRLQGRSVRKCVILPSSLAAWWYSWNIALPVVTSFCCWSSWHHLLKLLVTRCALKMWHNQENCFCFDFQGWKLTVVLKIWHK